MKTPWKVKLGCISKCVDLQGFVLKKTIRYDIFAILSHPIWWIYTTFRWYLVPIWMSSMTPEWIVWPKLCGLVVWWPIFSWPSLALGFQGLASCDAQGAEGRWPNILKSQILEEWRSMKIRKSMKICLIGLGKFHHDRALRPSPGIIDFFKGNHAQFSEMGRTIQVSEIL